MQLTTNIFNLNLLDSVIQPTSFADCLNSIPEYWRPEFSCKCKSLGCIQHYFTLVTQFQYDPQLSFKILFSRERGGWKFLEEWKRCSISNYHIWVLRATYSYWYRNINSTAGIDLRLLLIFCISCLDDPQSWQAIRASRP